MKPSFTTGVSKTSRIAVDRDRTISFMGEEGRVYATPRMIADMEQTCRDLIVEHADPGEDSVGMEIAVQHLAPTLLGMNVEVTVTVAALEGRKVTFDVSAKDDVEQIGKGRHTRFIVDVNKQVERLKSKAAKRGA